MEFGKQTRASIPSAVALRRRSVLAASLATVAALWSGRGYAVAPQHPATDWPLGLDPAWCFPDRAAAARMGQLILDTVPGHVLAPLPGRPRWPRILTSSAERKRMTELVSRKVRLDFSDGKTVTVDGWVLALTEARLCASLARNS